MQLAKHFPGKSLHGVRTSLHCSLLRSAKRQWDRQIDGQTDRETVTDTALNSFRAREINIIDQYIVMMLMLCKSHERKQEWKCAKVEILFQYDNMTISPIILVPVLINCAITSFLLIINNLLILLVSSWVPLIVTYITIISYKKDFPYGLVFSAEIHIFNIYCY